jgi:hypothetical protein
LELWWWQHKKALKTLLSRGYSDSGTILRNRNNALSIFIENDKSGIVALCLVNREIGSGVIYGGVKFAIPRSIT